LLLGLSPEMKNEQPSEAHPLQNKTALEEKLFDNNLAKSDDGTDSNRRGVELALSDHEFEIQYLVRYSDKHKKMQSGDLNTLHFPDEQEIVLT
jgi:hypothetical protein